MVPSHLDCETGRGRLGRGKREAENGREGWRGVVARKGESDLRFWEGEGEKGKAGGGVAAGKGESDLGFWEGEGEKGKAGGGWQLERGKVI